MGFLDRAKQLADQAREKAEEALAEVRARSAQPGTATESPGAPAPDPRLGTPYVPGSLGRAGWREQGLTDPAAVLPVAARESAGLPHSVRSQVLEEPFGMGRRWTAEGRSAGLYYQLYPDHYAWEPPGGKAPYPEVPGALAANLADGRSLVFLSGDDRPVVLEVMGVGDVHLASLARSVTQQLASS